MAYKSTSSVDTKRGKARGKAATTETAAINGDKSVGARWAMLNSGGKHPKAVARTKERKNNEQSRSGTGKATGLAGHQNACVLHAHDKKLVHRPTPSCQAEPQVLS